MILYLSVIPNTLINCMLQVIQFGNMSIHDGRDGERSNNTIGLPGPRPLHIKHPAAMVVRKMHLDG